METTADISKTQSLPASESLPFIPESAAAKPAPPLLSNDRTPQTYDVNWLSNEVRFLRKAIVGLIIGIGVMALVFGVMQYLADQKRDALREELRTLKSDYRSLEDRFGLLVDLMVTEREAPADRR